MNRKNFILTSLGALCAAAFGRASTFAIPASPIEAPIKKNGADKMTSISCDRGIGYDGKKTIGWGWMFRDKSDKNGDYIERTAVILEPENETRGSIVWKLRMLADSIETGKGAIMGENTLTGEELNALDYEYRSPYANFKADQEAHSYLSEDERRWLRCWRPEIVNATPEQITAARASANAHRLAARAAKGLD